MKNIKLKGEIQADETYESINLKGTKKDKMPRFSKSRSSNGGSKRGISGPITLDEVEKNFY